MSRNGEPHHKGPADEWPDEAVAELRRLWDTGMSIAKIGGELGRSKNAVAAKADRLDLPARPSPIKQSPDPGSKVRKRLARGAIRRGASTLPPLPSEVPDAR